MSSSQPNASVDVQGIGAQLPIGSRIELPGHFDVPVILEDARGLGPDGSRGYECRVRLPDGTLEEVVISAAEAARLTGEGQRLWPTVRIQDAEKLRLLVESTRIRLAYSHDPHFAVSLSGIRTLPHQIGAVYRAMLPQPRLRFLLADDPGAGKTIMAGLLIKELKLREAVERREREDPGLARGATRWSAKRGVLASWVSRATRRRAHVLGGLSLVGVR